MMKLTPNSPELAPLLVFGAHPDDIEFGCGGIIARETLAGRKAHFVVCSRGEAGTHGTPKQRTAEAKKAMEDAEAQAQHDGGIEPTADHEPEDDKK